MKKVLFLFAFLLLGIGAMAQKVIYDETNQTGVRTVVYTQRLIIHDGTNRFFVYPIIPYR